MILILTILNFQSQNKVLILLNEPIAKEDVMKVTVIRNGEAFEIPSVKKRNPYTLIFRMPEEFLAVSLLVTIRVERNGVDLGAKLLKCESQLYAMAQILKSCDNPVEFMCQVTSIQILFLFFLINNFFFFFWCVVN